VIKPLTKSEFVSIATNGIRINLYDGFVEDYIESLMTFIEDVAQDYYVSDHDTAWLEISKRGAPAIKVVYMHSVAWDAINNDGKVNQPVEPWPV